MSSDHIIEYLDFVRNMISFFYICDEEMKLTRGSLKRKLEEKEQQADHCREAPTVQKQNNCATEDTISPMRIRLGLCCINSMLRDAKPAVFCSRSMTLASIAKRGLTSLQELCIQNVNDLIPLIEWNQQHGIKCLRICSDLFPHASNPRNPYPYEVDFASNELKLVGDKVRQYGHRVTMHPGQYNVIGTPDDSAFENTTRDLLYHAQVLDLMGADQHSILVVHGGGVYGDKDKTIQRWCTNFERLPEAVRRRLVLENDERCFSPLDCLQISSQVNIPVVFDNHHFECYYSSHEEEREMLGSPSQWIKPCLDTWARRNIRPKFHISEQRVGARLGSHSDFIQTIPDYYLEIPEKYGVGVDIMVEAKAKEAAILELYRKYPYLKC